MNLKAVRTYAISIILMLAIGMSWLAPAQAAAKAGMTCKRVGAVEVVAKKKFTCIKSGKKLAWSKGVPVTLKPPVTNPSAIETPMPVQNIVVPARATSFQEAARDSSGITYWAWKLGAEKIANSTSTKVEVREIYGPNSKSHGVNTELVISNVTRLFEGFANPKVVHVIMFNLADVSWAQQKYESLNPLKTGEEMRDAAAHNCRTADTCWGASVDVAQNGDGIVLLTVDDLMKNHRNHTTGTLQAHEYAHIMMQAQMPSLAKPDQAAASWYWEGLATYTQAVAVYNGKYEDYLAERKNFSGELFMNKIHTNEWINSFLSSTSGDWRVWQKYPNWRKYDIGMRVIEILINVGGIDSAMNVFKLLGENKGFEEAFKITYKSEWGEVRPLISEVISRELGY